MDPDLDLTPTWSKVRHIWDCSQRWSGPSRIAIKIWILRWIQIQSWPPTWSKVRHRWDCSQRWSGLSKSTTQIWIWRWIQIWTWPPHDLRWDIYGTAARDGVDSQKLQHKYGSGDGSRSGVDPPTWSNIRHRWDCSQRWSGPSRIAIKIWILRWIQIQSWPPHDLRWDP